MDSASLRRRRIVIDDSSSSDSSSCASVSSLHSDYTDSHQDVNGYRNEDVGDVVASMGKVTIAESPSLLEGRRHVRRCKRYAIENLKFDSDSDSSLEIFTPVFTKATTKTTFLDDDSSVEIVEETNNMSNCGKKKREPKESETAWTMDRLQSEYFLESTHEKKMPNFRIPLELYEKMFDHQRSGVSWIAGLHSQKIGGVLGDDMGMGKTYMTLTLLGGLMRAATIRNALIVAPLSVLRSWESEAMNIIKLCVPDAQIQVLSSDVSQSSRSKRLREAMERSESSPCLIITTYGLVASKPLDFVHDYFAWDYIILDEAHKIKNPTAQVSKSVRRIARSEGTRRLILTGTPIMNNLRELWALFDFATSGKVLGKLPSFKKRFANPIENARSSDADRHMIRIGEKANLKLQQKLKPYLLQRLKVDFLADKLPKKQDFVVWTQLSKKQRSMYSSYVESGDSAVANVLTGVTTSPLEAVTWLKKLCGHPILVKKGQHLSKKSFENMEPNELKRDSSKLKVLEKLVERLSNLGHRTLIFSQSTKMLDIIERVLHRFLISRIDGSTKEKDRQRRVDLFNNPHSDVEIMLLSTKATGVGLTLTGADRAIIYDPSWNPAEDSQAVDRCYRIGQTKEVAVFRLITAGSVEEKMYEKQVHKDGIRRAVMTNMGSATTRYFDNGELRKLFTLGPEGECQFLKRLRERGFASHQDSPESKLTSHEGVLGVSSHDSLYGSNSLVIIDGDQTENKENPFSISQAQPRLSIAKEVMVKDGSTIPLENASNKLLGRSQRALRKIREKDKAEMVWQMEKSQKSDGEAAKNRAVPVVKEPPNESLEGILSTIDTLRVSGNLESALMMLMDVLEKRYHKIGKEEKLKIHERTASIAYELQWL